MIWKIATAGLACLAVSGWGLAYWQACKADESRERKDIFDGWEACWRWAKACCDDAVRWHEENKKLRKTVARLRARTQRAKDWVPELHWDYRNIRAWVRMKHEGNYGAYALMHRLVAHTTNWNIARWREDRTTGNWGKYLCREREIREVKAS